MSERKSVLNKKHGEILFGSEGSENEPELSEQMTKLSANVAARYLRKKGHFVLAELSEQDGVSDGEVARRSIESIGDRGRDALINEAREMNYPAFIMGDQIVIYFTEDAVVKQVAGEAVVKG